MSTTATQTITNTGTAALVGTVVASTASGGNWLSVSPTNYNLAAGQSATLTATATPGSLAAGTYNGTVTLTDNAAGSPQTLTATLTISSTGTLHLAFTTQPGGAAAGSALNPQPVVTVQNADNSTNTGFSGNVAVALNNAAGATLGGTTSVAATNGVATFAGLNVNNAGNGYGLHATAPGATAADSSAFNVTGAAPATYLHTDFSGSLAGVSSYTDAAGKAMAGTNYSGTGLAALTTSGGTGYLSNGSSQTGPAGFYGNSGQQNVTAKLLIGSAFGANQGAIVMARGDAAQPNTGYGLFFYSGSLYITKYSGGAFVGGSSNIATGTATLAAGSLVELVANGSTLTAFHTPSGGSRTQICTATDSSPLSGTYCGFGGGSGNSNAVTFADFRVTA